MTIADWAVVISTAVFALSAVMTFIVHRSRYLKENIPRGRVESLTIWLLAYSKDQSLLTVYVHARVTNRSPDVISAPEPTIYWCSTDWGSHPTFLAKSRPYGTGPSVWSVEEDQVVEIRGAATIHGFPTPTNEDERRFNFWLGMDFRWETKKEILAMILYPRGLGKLVRTQRVQMRATVIWDPSDQRFSVDHDEDAFEAITRSDMGIPRRRLHRLIERCQVALRRRSD